VGKIEEWKNLANDERIRSEAAKDTHAFALANALTEACKYLDAGAEQEDELFASLNKMRERAKKAENKLKLINSLSEAVWEKPGEAAKWVMKIMNGDPLDGLQTQEAHETAHYRMVCSGCLKTHYAGEAKSCSHGVILGGGFRHGACADCGREVAATADDYLHCPSGVRQVANATTTTSTP
jgi:hypothetical protein